MTGAAEGSWEGDPHPGRRRTTRWVSSLVGAALALGALSGCTLLGDDDATTGPGTSAAPAPPGVVDELKRVLRRRAVAVREGDEQVFRSGLARRGGDFGAAQAAYFRAMHCLRPWSDQRRIRRQQR